jgi:hypothetical protein
MEKEIVCVVCGVKLHKDEETKKMDKLYNDVWKGPDGEFGSDDPEHWHTTIAFAA